MTTDPNPKTVVNVEIIIGLNLACPASKILSISGTHFFVFSLILSTKKIAVLTITHKSEINPIPKAILYGFPVTHSHILTPSKAVTIEYSTIAGLEKELNWYTSKTNVIKSAIKNAMIAD